MSHCTKRDTDRLKQLILRLSLHGNPELALSTSKHPMSHNLSVLWQLGMHGDGDGTYDDPVMFPDPEDKSEPKKRPFEDDTEEQTSKQKTSSDIQGAMHELTVVNAPPVPHWHVSRQNHCMYTIRIVYMQ